MTKNEEHLEHLAEIRALMEKSSRFLSLSGLSGIFAGIIALIGASYVFYKFNYRFYPYYEQIYHSDGSVRIAFAALIMSVAVIVLILALLSAFYFTKRRAKSQGENSWNKVSKRMLINLAIPLITGGVFCGILLLNSCSHLVASAMLVFYGLSLLNASKYTLNDIRYLGLSEVILGLAAGFFLGYALLFWAIGFGLLHIIYGSIMYYKYEK
jgi:hypothetical protein